MKRRILMLAVMLILLTAIPVLSFASGKDVTSITLEAVPEPAVGEVFYYRYTGFEIKDDSPFDSYMAYWQIKMGDAWVRAEAENEGFMPDQDYRLIVYLYGKNEYNFLKDNEITLSNFKAGTKTASKYEYLGIRNGAVLCFDYHTPKADKIVPVEDIIMSETSFEAGSSVYFQQYRTVLPENASNKAVLYTITDLDETGTKLYNASWPAMTVGGYNGKVRLTMTVKNGKGEGRDFVKDFIIQVTGGAENPNANKNNVSGVINDLQFELDIPNHGEEYPNGEAGIASVTKVPEGVKVTDVESIMFGRRIDGAAVKGDEAGFGITYEVLPGYELASDFTVSINGKAADRILTPQGVRKASTREKVTITYNPNIAIIQDLPAEITYTDGEDIEVEIKASGKSVKYLWQLGTQSSGGAKQKFAAGYTDITGYSGPTVVIKFADASYDGKLLRCILSNDNGQKYSSVATLKLESDAPAEAPGEPHVHIYTPGYDDDCHWEACACGEIKLIEDHDIDVKHDADGHWGECECGYRTEKEEHEFGEWKVVKAATEKAEGLQERTCSVCSYKEEITIAPPTPKAPEELTTPFIDVPKDAYYYDATVWAYNAKPQITDGNGKDKFMPEQICTRGQVVTFLWRSAGQPAPAKTVNPFEDVKKDDYFYQPVLWAFYNDTQITDGTDPTHFSPNNPCRNSHILTFIHRALGEPGKSEKPETWYTDAYNWAKYDANLLEGTFTGSYDVNAQCPRKNVVQYLYTYYTMSGGK